MLAHYIIIIIMKKRRALSSLIESKMKDSNKGADKLLYNSSLRTAAAPQLTHSRKQYKIKNLF